MGINGSVILLFILLVECLFMVVSGRLVKFSWVFEVSMVVVYLVILLWFMFC